VGSRAEFLEMNRAIALHAMKPVVDHAFPFTDTRAAFEHMLEGKHFGKVCIRVGDGK
jgi:NADPH:quinone reductase-like Zn-dependent oxidoreductase